MNIILMTILLTTIGLCLVAFLVWLGISSIVLMKFKKKSEEAFKHLERWVNDNHDEMNRILGDLNNDILKRIDENRDEMIHNLDEIYKTRESDFNSLSSKIDSRCDKIQEKLDNLKKEVDVYYKLLRETQSNLELISTEKAKSFTIK